MKVLVCEICRQPVTIDDKFKLVPIVISGIIHSMCESHSSSEQRGNSDQPDEAAPSPKTESNDHG